MQDGKNYLGAEQSPYLLQHRDNPVWWHPWGDAAFERARREDKPVFLSIGYSTCYWCHVMESDSFERQEVADLLNQHFVSIKVDREELPDVDQIYMDVVIAIHGHGGWPMSVFLTPDRKPFWGGTFFYRDQFMRILTALADGWRNEREKVLVSSEELTRYLLSQQRAPAGRRFEPELFHRAAEELLRRFDSRDGGFGRAPKFPPSQQLLFLMRYSHSQPGAVFDEAISLTLTSMACGGIFDQLGGGFHRYSVDAQWLIPHFEKMLYDNALLAQVYLEAFTKTGKELYRAVAIETIEYLLRDMRSGDGGFYAAEDAGEVGREGEFYAWTLAAIEEVLGADRAQEFAAQYGVSPDGNFEHGTSVLTITDPQRWEESRGTAAVAARSALLARRQTRARPHRDEKIITGWNGLVITALSRAYQVVVDPRYLEAATSCARCILDLLRREGRLLRRYCAGDARFEATLEDYAYFIQGLLALFEVSGDSQWMSEAIALQDEQDARLWVPSARAYATSAAPGNIVQQCEWNDGATPAPNGIALGNLAVLAAITGDSRFAARADELEQGIPAELFQHPSHYCATVLSGLRVLTGSPVCGVVVEPASRQPAAELWALWQGYHPLTTTLWSSLGTEQVPFLRDKVAKDGRTTFFLCQNRSCSEPIVAVEAAVDLCSQGSRFRVSA